MEQNTFFFNVSGKLIPSEEHSDNNGGKLVDKFSKTFLQPTKTENINSIKRFHHSRSYQNDMQSVEYYSELSREKTLGIHGERTIDQNIGRLHNSNLYEEMRWEPDDSIRVTRTVLYTV